MCKVLFPEWTFITFEKYAIMGAGWDYDFNNICFSKKSETLFDIEINIHWFEFCMTYLSDRLFELIEEKIGKNQASLRKTFNHRCLFVRDESERFISHPIDYLYEDFKHFNIKDNDK